MSELDLVMMFLNNQMENAKRAGEAGVLFACGNPALWPLIQERLAQTNDGSYSAKILADGRTIEITFL